ncbi:hypothetical protein [Xanthomonas arboricola]|uniref:hypothetical protein n=1 Tax=Xanthomonas arboricola TaxID=56448 RepID=UPI003B87A286
MNEQSGNSGQLQSAEDLRQAVHDALGQALGDSYDCTRVWEAWQVGTMSQDDFSLITDDSARMWEITDAVLATIAARQPVGVEPVAKLHSDGYWTCEPGRDPFDRFGPNKNAAAISVCAAPPAPAAVPVDASYSLDADPEGIRSRVADCIAGTMMVGAQNHTPPPAGHWLEPFWNMARADATQPQPADVPVDERQDAAIVEAAKLAYGLLWMGTNLTGPDLAHRARVALRDALGKQACGEGINAARATNPQPAAASVPDLFVQWLEREMPAGTIIGKPAWWAPKLARALRSAERGVLGGCNG